MVTHNRFHLPKELCSQPRITINDKGLIHHIRNVKRLKENDYVRIFDGEGREYSAVITRIEGSTVELEKQMLIRECTSSLQEQRIGLICALPKSDGISQILRLTIPLGIRCVTPLISEHSEVVISSREWNKKVVRYNTIVESVCTQCERLFIPTIQQPITFNELLKQELTNALLCHSADDSSSIKDILSKLQLPTEVWVVIGPEGGFSSAEIERSKLERPQWYRVHLGAYRLRVELAAVVAVHSIYYEVFQ